MTLESKKSQLTDYGIDYSIISPSGVKSQEQVTMGSNWSLSTTKRNAELFNVGGGSVYNSYPEFNHGFGSHVFIPNQTFIGMVHVWGAGGGGYHNSGSRSAGGGGFTQVVIRFLQNVPYTIVVGQAGTHNELTTHGGGGRGHHSGTGGSGGGLSGIFFDTNVIGSAPWAGTPTVSQANALVIAGGGGGGGHHNQASHYGNAGGGGGWNGKRAHNSTGGTQTGGGNAGYAGSQAGFALHGGHSGSNTSWLGGGGGGWFGGGGGGHTPNHHNGGSGGSGHHAYDSSVASQPNNNLARFILNGFTEKAPGHQDFTSVMPASLNHPLGQTEGRPAGQGGFGENLSGHGANWGSRHGKVVITMLPDFIGGYMDSYPRHTSSHDNTGWTQSF